MAVGDARETVLALLAKRRREATVCPSEVARALAAQSGLAPTEDDWRRLMPLVHAAIDQLVVEQQVRLTWKGNALVTRAGPYRIGRGASE